MDRKAWQFMGSQRVTEQDRTVSPSSLLSVFIEYYSIKAEKAMVPHSRTLAWKIPWTEEPGRLQSMGLLRVGHN